MSMHDTQIVLQLQLELQIIITIMKYNILSSVILHVHMGEKNSARLEQHFLQ